MLAVLTSAIRQMPKNTYIQVRIREDVKEELRLVADARGLTISALIHSMIVKTIRDERTQHPEVFISRQNSEQGLVDPLLPVLNLRLKDEKGKKRKAE